MVIVCALAVPLYGGRYVQERLIYQYDFDERAFNFGDLPKDWFVMGRRADTSDPIFKRQPMHRDLVQRVGYPKYNKIHFDKRHKTSGEESLYLGVNSGHAGVFLQMGAVAAVPGSDYLITVRVRTADLEHSSAFFTAYFVDAQGLQIEASTMSNQGIQTEGKWQTISLRLDGDFPEAAYVGMQLELLQPQKQKDNPLGDHQLVFQDVRGSVWFDDVMVWQLPSVSLTTDSQVNIHRSLKPPTIKASVRDLTGRPLYADLSAYDHLSNRVAHQRSPVGAGEPTDWTWTLPVSQYGWYLLDLKVYEATPSDDFDIANPITRKISVVQWLGPDPLMLASDAGRFGIIGEGLSDVHLGMMQEVLESSGLRGITLSAWNMSTTRQTMDKRQKLLDKVVLPMLAIGGQVTLSFSPLPQKISTVLDVDVNSPMSMFALPARQWEQLIAPMLMNQGQRIGRWQLGTVDMPDAFFMRDAPKVVAAVKSDFENLAPKPHLILPWRANQARRPELKKVGEYLIEVPFAVRAEHIGEHLGEWSNQPSETFSLHLREPTTEDISHTQRVEDLVLRMLYGWEAGAAGLHITKPWTRADERKPSLLPDPLLGVFASVAHRLAGRRVIARLPISEGVQCMILNGPSGGMLAAWNSSAAENQGQIDMYLGPSPQVVDCWGNRKAVTQMDGRHQYLLGSVPVFFEGIDPQLALFRAGFKLDQPFIASLQKPHERTLTLANPWDRTINGYMLITGPKGWDIEPRRSHFSIAAGRSRQFPVKIIFPVSEVAGHKKLTAKFVFTASKQYRVDMSTPMELGLEQVQFDATAALEPVGEGKTDLVVTAIITNRSEKPFSMYAFANLMGFPLQERIVSGLRPGQSIVQRFRFTSVDPQEVITAGKIIRVGLREASGPAVVNKKLSMADLGGA